MIKPVDIVYTWVDGNDPELNSRRLAYTSLDKEIFSDDIGGSTRYSNLGELFWSVASVNRFMPWIRKIFIVTDGQNPMPQLEELKKYFDHLIPVEVVDHKDIFVDYEDTLPVFNCNSIETMLWRIPDLSDHYIYFNDDTFVASEMHPEEWFKDDKLILHGFRMPLWWASFLDKMRIKKGKHILGFKTPMISAAKTLGTNHILHSYHTPTAQSKKLLEEFFTGKEFLIRRNVTPKFRDKIQFSPQALCNLLAEQKDKLILDKTNNNLFLKPTSDRPDYLIKKFKKAEKKSQIKLGCISSLDKASKEQQQQFEAWISKRLDIKR